MSGVKDSDNVGDLRKRLYERGKSPIYTEREKLSRKEPKVRRTFNVPGKTTQLSDEATGTVNMTAPAAVATAPVRQQTDVVMATRRQKRTYRLKILLAGVFFFVGALVVSSFFLLFGNNNISGENIAIAVTGPFTIGGGEVLPLQVGITNSNAVPIQAATLIVDYPPGTKAANEDATDLFTERLSLETIGSGETINVPVRAVVFGEENQDKTVEVSIEYRVQGSNATFFKEAEPLRFKISSSPVVVTADNFKKVSSGQETEVEIMITSNAPTTLPEVLVKAEYPLGFDFTSSSPGPSSGQNMWLIENLEPESSQTITVKGVVVGTESDEHAINFSVGVPNERDRQNLASIFATAQTFFEIEQPFLDIRIAVDGSEATEAAVEPDKRAEITVSIKNTLDEAIYDTEIDLTFGGNAFSVFNVFTDSGYYDSTAKKITWDVSNTKELQVLEPGDTEDFRFSIEPRGDIGRTPQLTLTADIKSRRVTEDRAAEFLTGTAASVIKITTAPSLLGEVGHNNGIFSDSGPVPPRVGVETKYTLSFMLQNGSNDLADAVVVTTLPQYVDWLDQTAGAGNITFNETNRVVEWDIGSLEAGAATFASFQVSFEPRVTQARTTPVLMGEQRARATDRFTGTVVRATNPAVTTKLSNEAGFAEGSGQVQN